MKSIFLQLTMKSMKRRYKEYRKVMIIAFISVFFIAAILIFQDNMNNYLMESNYTNYGDWIIGKKAGAKEAIPSFAEHPYFTSYGVMTVGKELLDEETGKTLGYYLGSSDDKLLDFGNIRVYEGKLPHKPDEIAMELNLLAKLGYSYDIGQTVKIEYLDKSGQLCTKEYQLCGTMVNYTSAWENGYMMPAALVADGSILPEERLYSIYYFHLNRKFEDINAQELFSSIKETSGNSIGLFYNSFVYDSGLWGNKTNYDGIVILFMFIGIASLTYLLLSYFNRRTPWYYKLRCIGATGWQIRKMIILESVIGCVPSAVLAIIAAYTAGAVFTGAVALYYHLDYFYEMRTESLGKIVLSSFVTLIAVVLMQLLLTVKAGKLAESTYEIPVKKLKKLRKSIKYTKRLPGSLISRQKRAFYIRTWSYRIFSIAVCCVLLFCLTGIYNAIGNYSSFMKLCKYDYTAKIDHSGYEKYPYDIDGNTGYMGVDYISCYNGFGEEFCQKLKAIKGIKSVTYSIQDGGHIFDWKGKENSPIRSKFSSGQGVTINKIRFFPEDGLIYGYASSFIKDTERYYQEVKDYIDSDIFDYRAFEKGEQILLLIRTSILSGVGLNSEDDIKENTISPGDTISVRTESGLLNLTVGDIIYENEVPILDSSTFKGLFTIVGSEKISQKMSEMDSKPLQPTSLGITLNGFASYEATAKQLSTLFTGDDRISFESNADRIKLAKTQYHQALYLYGLLFGIILLIYIILHRNIIQSIFLYRRKSITLLKNLGMGFDYYQKLIIKEGLTEGLWCLPAIVISSAYKWYSLVKAIHGTNSQYFIKLLGKYSTNLGLGYFLDLPSFYPFIWSILFIVFVTAMISGQYYYVFRSYKSKAAADNERYTA